MSDPQLLGNGIEGTYPTDSITTAANRDGYASQAKLYISIEHYY